MFWTDFSFPVDNEKGQSIKSISSSCVSQVCFYSPQCRKRSVARICCYR